MRFIAVDHVVDAVGLHFTVQVAEAEFVLMYPAIVYVAPIVHPVMSWRTPPPPVALVLAICWYLVPPPGGGEAVCRLQTVVGFVARW